jgi:hypothetical protein
MRLPRLLGALAHMGMPRSMLAVLAELGQVEAGDGADETHWLHGPLVVHSAGGWHQDLPQWARQQAIAERWLIVNGELPGHLVGPAELLCVMYAASLEAPRGERFTDLYCWATAKAVERWKGVSAEATLKAAGARVSDADVLEPKGRLHHDYRMLAGEIRRKVANARREELKAAKREAVPEPKAKPTAPARVEREQFAMFA